MEGRVTPGKPLTARNSTEGEDVGFGVRCVETRAEVVYRHLCLDWLMLAVEHVSRDRLS